MKKLKKLQVNDLVVLNSTEMQQISGGSSGMCAYIEGGMMSPPIACSENEHCFILTGVVNSECRLGFW